MFSRVLGCQSIENTVKKTSVLDRHSAKKRVNYSMKYNIVFACLETVFGPRHGNMETALVDEPQKLGPPREAG